MPRPPRRSQRRRERAVARDHDLGAARFERVARVRRRAARLGRRHDDDRPGVACREHARVGRRPQAPVEDRRASAAARGTRRAPSAADRRPGSVPTPTPIASTSARTRCAWRFAAAEVSARPRAGRLGDAAVQRSIAAFRITNGRPSRISVKNGWLSARPPRRAERRRRRRCRARADTRSPGRCTSGFGSSTAATTRAMPASTMRVDARARCGRCGSTARACSTASRRARARRPSSSACTSACGSPARA